jgi:hypothetical protein
VVAAFFHQAGDKRQFAAKLSQFLQLDRFYRQRDARHRVAKKITGEAQLGKEQEVGFFLDPSANAFLVERQVGREISELGVDLGNSDADRHYNSLLHRAKQIFTKVT